MRSGHEGLVTCVTPCPANPNLFVTGGRDARLMVWDLRTDGAVGTFGAPRGPGGGAAAHDQMVTSVDAAGNLLLSGGADNQIMLWDLRCAA